MSKPNWIEIRREWETTKITFKALAENHNVPEGTLKSRRSREKWSRDATNKKDATISKEMQPKKKNKEPVVESDNLTDKQRLFCIYYIKYFNATKAYQKAYECDYVSARTNGSRLLTNANIISEIQRTKKEQTSGLMLDVKDVLQKYIDIAFADIGDYVEVDEGGFMVKVKPLDHMDTSIIGELSNTENGIKLKLADKMKAMDMLAKYTDLLSDNDKKRLQEEKLKTEIAKTKAETKNEETGSTKTIVLTNEEEMRKVITERKAAKENE
ncbi:MAG TPA: terminase small subunit [Atopostipes sp.]|nr:terminase small subunit [Atopostipes sp.]